MNIVAHNLLAMNAQRVYGISEKDRAKSAEKLSSGFKINRAADGAAELSISEKMRNKIRGLNRGAENTQDGISFVQVADGAMQEVTDMLQRMNELAIQAANGTNSPSDRLAIDNEIQELKKEINRVNETTTFNTIRVFDEDENHEYYDIDMDITGQPSDMEIFNATYNSQGDVVTWGGIDYLGTRYSWDAINPDMVELDINGQQVFKGGTYHLRDSVTGHTLEFRCEDGDIPPKVNRVAKVTKGKEGVIIDGEPFDLNSLKDEAGEPISRTNYHPGIWTANFGGMNININLRDEVGSKDEFFQAVESLFDKSVWSLECTYTNNDKREQAVDAIVSADIRLSEYSKNQLLSDKRVAYFVHADDNGVSLSCGAEDSFGNIVDQTEIAGSRKTWAELGISSWDSGRGISEKFIYEYSDSDGVNDTFLEFTFSLSQVTSKDSVIDGLNGMRLDGKNFKIKNDISYEIGNMSQNVSNIAVTHSGSLSLDEEIALGRNFDQQQHLNLSNASIVYDGVSGKYTVDFPDQSGTNVNSLHYETPASMVKTEMADDLNTYVKYVEKLKEFAVVNGLNPDTVSLNAMRMESVMGNSAITDSHHLTYPLTITAGMKLTDGDNGFEPGIVGNTYGGAKLDFDGLGSRYELDDLYALGFNSTCQTCSNHYTVMFGSGTAQTTANGFSYTKKSQGNNYLLLVDIESLKNQGVTNGEELAGALVDIMSECYDFHFTQYAADGSKFFLYDNRTRELGSMRATFDTIPYFPIYMDQFGINLINSSDPTRNIEVKGNYNYSDIASQVHVQMGQDANGDYIKKDDGTYVFYNPANDAGKTRYKLSTSYTNSNGTGTNIATMINEYSNRALTSMFQNINFQCNARDYVRGSLSGDENPNVAVRAIFDMHLYSRSTQVPNASGLMIQHSNEVSDHTFIPRYKLGLNAMHLTNMNVLTEDSATEAIGRVSYALNYLTEKRSIYGAYQNRLEYNIAINKNTEENMTSAESRIRDTDMSQEMVKYAKHSILSQAGQSMMAQANQSTQGILSLLQ